MLLPRELAEWLSLLLARRRDRRSCEALGGSGLVERTLADAAIDRHGLAYHRADSTDDMARMARHFGLEPKAVPEAYIGALRDAERICARCVALGRCRRWQDEAMADAPRLFCPNAPLFDEVSGAQRDRTAPS